MFEQQRHIPKRLIAIVVLVVLLLIILAFAVFSGRGNKTNTSDARKINLQRREAVMDLMTGIKAYAKDHNNTFPLSADANNVFSEQRKSLPLDPTSNKAFVLQSSAPTASNQIQYATSVTCTDNLYAFKKTSSAKDMALLIKDDLTGYFCLSNQTNYKS